MSKLQKFMLSVFILLGYGSIPLGLIFGVQVLEWSFGTALMSLALYSVLCVIEL